MKQCSLFALMSKSVPKDKESESKENKKMDISSDIKEEQTNFTNISDRTTDRSNSAHGNSNIMVKKRLKLAKQGTDNASKRKHAALSDVNELLMTSEDRSSKSENDIRSIDTLDGSQQDGEQIMKAESEREKESYSNSSTSTTAPSQSDHTKTKESISYSDFLAMFQNSSGAIVHNINDDSTQIGNDTTEQEDLEREDLKVKESGKKSDIANCKSIASYFKPSESKSMTQRTRTTQVTITADIHTSSSNSDHKPPCPDSVLDLSCEIVDVENRPETKTRSEKDEEIVLLSSEIIDDDFEEPFEDVKCKKNGRKKKQINKMTKSVLSVKAETLKRSIEDKISSPNPSSNTLSRVVCDKNSPQSTFQQSRLTFGKLGLSVSETGQNEGEDCREQDSTKIQEINKLICIEKTTDESTVTLTASTKGPEEKESKTCRLKSHNAERIHDKDSVNMTEMFKTSIVTDVLQVQDNVRLSKDNGLPSSKSAALDLLQTNQSEVESQNDDSSTPVLRRSSRIKTSLQTKREVEVVEIDVDIIDETVDAKKPKKSKQQTSNADRTSVKPSGGKLAPIFMRGKTVEEEPKKTEPPEDPEKVRARKEFLLSGIPDELRRIIAATASACIEADYPPFPQISHVLQISPQTTLSPNLSVTKLRPALKEKDVFDCFWTEVTWPIESMNPVASDESKISSFNLPLDESQTELLLGKMGSLDSTFPFLDTYKNCVKKRNQDSCTSTSEDFVIIDDDSPCTVKHVSQTSEVTKDYMWSDLYQPCHSQEIIGNLKTIKQLKEWLTEWHSLMQKEVQKAAKGKKAPKRPFKTDADWSADSDFTDSDEEDCRLCNTMLITGPHGIGKTSTVYALAQEIGFKVFEVNASSLRSGKQLLCQLEEATQSHRVASNSLPVSAVKETPPAGSKVCDQKPSSTTKPKTASNSAAFANLFRKANNSVKSTDTTKAKDQEGKKKQSSKSMEKQEAKGDSPRRKSRKKKPPDVEIKAVEVDPKINGRALNITSTSLILFDEADIVFEEDKGFLATVQHFMTSTKIPIILTSTDPSLHLQLSPRHHHVSLKQPTLKSTVGFLYSVCLASGIHSDYHSLSNVVKMLNGDLRQCLLQLQFWCGSGGGRGQTRECSDEDFSPQIKFPSVEKSLQTFSLSGEDTSGVKLQSLKPFRKRPRMIIDDNSNSSEASSHISDQEFSVLMLSSDQPQPEKSGLSRRSSKPQSGGMSHIKEKPVNKWPVLHYGCDALLFGESAKDISGNALVNFLKTNYNSTSQIASFIDHYASLRRLLYGDIIYSLALYCCNLPLTSKASTVLEIHSGNPNKETSSKRKRKRILSDCFDSEGSEDEKETGIETNPHANPSAPSESEVIYNSIPSNDNDQEMKEDDRNDESKQGGNDGINSEKCERTENKMVKEPPSDDYLFHIKALSHFSKFYDNVSCVSFLEASLGSEISESSLRPGVEDQLTSKDSVTPKAADASERLCSCIDLLSARTFTSGMSKCIKTYNERQQNLNDTGSVLSSDSWKTDFELPIGSSLPDIWASSKKKSGLIREQAGDLKDCLGLLTHGSSASFYTDYLPMLREVCRFEHERQVSNKKRRFHHYFDHIGLDLKESTLTSLSSTYTVIN